MLLAGLWVVGLTSMAIFYLLRGNGVNHNGLSPLVSPQAEDFYRGAVLHAREIRDRFTFLDLAADSGLLDTVAAA